MHGRVVTRLRGEVITRGVEGPESGALDRDRQEPQEEGRDRARSPMHAMRRELLVSTREVEAEGYEYWIEERKVQAELREEKLVDSFISYLHGLGRSVTRESIPVESSEIVYDLFERDRRILYEAKADASSRSQIRMAIGQLFDYAYNGFRQSRIRLALLLPDEPTENVGELLGYLDIGVVWQTADGFDEDLPWQEEPS